MTQHATPEFVASIFGPIAAVDRDPAWVDLFDRAAVEGVLPKTVTVSARPNGGAHLHLIRRQRDGCDLPADDPAAAGAAVKAFFRSIGVYMTARDAHVEERAFAVSLARSSSSRGCWSDVRALSLRALMLNEYVNRAADDGGLDRSRRTLLRRLLDLGQACGAIGKDNIECERARISDVTPIRARDGRLFVCAALLAPKPNAPLGQQQQQQQQQQPRRRQPTDAKKTLARREAAASRPRWLRPIARPAHRVSTLAAFQRQLLAIVAPP